MCIKRSLVTLLVSLTGPLGTVQFSPLFGPDGQVNYDYIVINSLLIVSRCIDNGAHINHS